MGSSWLEHRGRMGGLAGLALMVMLGVWVMWHVTGVIGYGDLVDRPHTMHDQSISLSLVRVAEVQGPEAYVVEKGALRLQVFGPSLDRVLGEDISVGGTWDGPREGLVQEWVEQRASGRSAKRRLGVIGVLGAVLLWLGCLRWTPSGWGFRG